MEQIVYSTTSIRCFLGVSLFLGRKRGMGHPGWAWQSRDTRDLGHSSGPSSRAGAANPFPVRQEIPLKGISTDWGTAEADDKPLTK